MPEPIQRKPENLEEILEESESYQEFVEKFKPKKTTDDCYTPDNIFRAVSNFVYTEYGILPSRQIRPFWPGGDYKAVQVPAGCAVVDNPPFSILSQIIDYYLLHGIPFFLFSPTLTAFQPLRKHKDEVCVIIEGISVTYANGANINTSFVTNLETSGACVRAIPELYKAVQREEKKNKALLKKELPKFEYPVNVLYAAKINYAQYSVAYSLHRDDCTFVSSLDSQRKDGKAIFGGGALLSSRAAADRAAADRAAADRAARMARDFSEWKLSERERNIIGQMDHIPALSEYGPEWQKLKGMSENMQENMDRAIDAIRDELAKMHDDMAIQAVGEYVTALIMRFPEEAEKVLKKDEKGKSKTLAGAFGAIAIFATEHKNDKSMRSGTAVVVTPAKAQEIVNQYYGFSHGGSWVLETLENLQGADQPAGGPNAAQSAAEDQIADRSSDIFDLDDILAGL